MDTLSCRQAWGPLCAVLAVLCAPPGSAQAGPPTLHDLVATRVESFQKTTGAVVGVSAVDLAAGRTLLALRDEQLFAPASNQKLLTSAFALARLGADFRFVTGVLRLGDDIVVSGDGDPTLGDPRIAAETGRTIYDELDRWAAAVRRDAGEQIGDILLCTGPTEGVRHRDWPAAQHSRWYAAPVDTLNFHDNCLDVTFRREGDQIVPLLQPDSRFIRLLNRLRTGADHSWSLRAEEDLSAVTVSGTAARPTDEALSVAIDRPALLLGRVFADRLQRAGVRLRGTVRAVWPGQIEWSRAAPLCLSTTPLAAVLHRANKHSLNMAAEAVFLRAGDGTWAGTAEMMGDTLQRVYGLKAGSFVVRDGGGLSRGGRVSPAAMTKLLAGVIERPDRMALLLSLPTSGADGTLSNRLSAPPYRGRVLAKTGYIAGVSCLSGYVLDDSRRVSLAFSILVNRLGGSPSPAKALQDGICALLVESLPPPAP